MEISILIYRWFLERSKDCLNPFQNLLKFLELAAAIRIEQVNVIP
jgi:hypothetical protein